MASQEAARQQLWKMNKFQGVESKVVEHIGGRPQQISQER